MLYVTALVLFESTTSTKVLQDSTSAEWLAVVNAVDGEQYESLARRYHLALAHFRAQRKRPELPGRFEVKASSAVVTR